MLEFLKKQLDRLLDERSTINSEAEAIIAKAESEKRDRLNDDEQSAFDEKRAAIKAKDAEIEAMQERVKDAKDAEARSQRVAASRAADATEARTETVQQGGAVVTSEPTVYRKGGQHSYFRDMMVVGLNRSDYRESLARLERNTREFEVETRALTTTDGAGGDFVPPLWMVADYVALARAARPTADRVRNLPLPTSTDSINLPKLATGTATAEQTTQNTAVQNTDATTSAVTGAVATIAGQQVVAVQLLEQSPVNLDDVLLSDLALDYATKVDVFVLNNNATNKVGLLNVSGVNAVAYTSGSPTVALLYSSLANHIQLIQTNRFMQPDTIVMHPRRWAYLLAATDANSRPLVLPAAPGAFNSLAQANQSVAQGVVGMLQGLEVITDPSMPTNLGAGTNQDPIIVMRSQDQYLYEGSPRSEAFRETKADQLSVLLRFYNYIAFIANRYPKSISVINGTGLVAPTF